MPPRVRRPEKTPEPPRARGVPVFLYGTSLPGQPDHRWVASLRTTPASVRGQLYRGPRSRPGLVPDSDGPPVRGVLVEVDPGLLAILDVMEGVAAGPFFRGRVLTSSLMRAVDAECYLLDPLRAVGFRRLRGHDWRDLTP